MHGLATSDILVPTGPLPPPVRFASADGFDTIVGFTFGVGGDKLDFSGITKAQFLASFHVDDTHDVNADGGADTVITIAGNADWSLTLLGVSGNNLDAFAANIFG